MSNFKKNNNFDELSKENSQDIDNINCPNCGTNDVEDVSSLFYLYMIFFSLSISLGLLVFGGEHLGAVGFISLFITIPFSIYCVFKSLGALAHNKKFKCNNCGNRFNPIEELKKEKKKSNLIMLGVMIGVFIFLFASFI